ncbi:hypothetical protein A7982_12106 [Minicystis rosea]|nr:hypothetical protein A7982_12106 [Minicystis rosea]
MWLVRGDARTEAHSLRGQPMTREMAKARVDAWFPGGFGDARTEMLASICRSLTGAFPGEGVPDATWLKRTLRRALEDGRLTAVRTRLPAPAGGLEEEPETVRRPAQVERASITYQVVDDATSDPIADVALWVALPDGREEEKRTDAEGYVRFEGIRPGRCSVRADRGERDLLHVLVFDGFGLHPVGEHGALGRSERWPRPTVVELDKKLARKPQKRALAITAVRRHRVRTGETLASIAKLHDLDERALLQFNFGTTDHAEVQRLLVREVGCRRRNLGTGDVVLSDRDRPGILYIPEPFKAHGQSTDHDYVIRVHRVRPAPPSYAFSL